MKQASTIDLFQNEKRRGRPITGDAKSDAQRMREYRQRRKEQGVRVVIQRPVDMEEIRQVIDDENNLYREIDDLRYERDAAMREVAELRKQLQAVTGILS